MLFISLNPFALKRFFVVLLVLIGLSCATGFADPLFLSVNSTPYDHQMSRIRPVLVSSHSGNRDVTLRLVNNWIGDLRSIPYGFTAVWKTPAETESGAPADCKAKAVALYQRMKSHGAKNVRLVIGRRTQTSRSTHTWVEWETDGGTYVLDPTINWMAFRSSDLSPRSYVPYYAYAGSHKYRTASSSLVASN
jgi:hypothetical protein